MSMLPIEEKVYDDGRTKQSFKDATDINKILRKAQKTGTLSHLQKHGGFYADFADFDFDEAKLALARATSIFEELPSEVRADFKQDPAAFFGYVNDPKNAGKLSELLPALAEPGRHPTVKSQAAKAAEASQEAAREPQANVPPVAEASAPEGS